MKRIVCLFLILMLCLVVGGCAQSAAAPQAAASAAPSDTPAHTAQITPVQNAPVPTLTPARSAPASTVEATPAQSAVPTTPAARISEEKAAELLTAYLKTQGITQEKDAALKIALDHMDQADGQDYYVFHVYDDMSDHTATLGWYGVQKDDGSLYDFVLLKAIPAK